MWWTVMTGVQNVVDLNVLKIVVFWLSWRNVLPRVPPQLVSVGSPLGRDLLIMPLLSQLWRTGAPLCLETRCDGSLPSTLC